MHNHADMHAHRDGSGQRDKRTTEAGVHTEPRAVFTLELENPILCPCLQKLPWKTVSYRTST